MKLTSFLGERIVFIDNLEKGRRINGEYNANLLM